MKRNDFSRILTILLALILTLQVLPFSAAAAETEIPGKETEVPAKEEDTETPDKDEKEEETQTYTVRYVDGFGNTLYKKTVKSGESVKPYGKRPRHPGFKFTCWDKKLPEKITEDITITALWAIDKSVPLTLTVFSDAKISGNDTQTFPQLVRTAIDKRGEVSALATTGNLVARYDDTAAWEQIRNTLWTLPGDMRFFNAAGPDDVNGAAGDYRFFHWADLCRANHFNFYDGGSIWFERSSREEIMLLGVGYRKPAETVAEKDFQYSWLKFINDAAQVYLGYKVVLLVSDYVDAGGNLTPFGKLLEEQVVAVNDNIRMVICGGGESASLVEKDYGGRKVNTVLLGGGAEGMTNLVFNLTDHSVDVAPVSGGAGFSIKNAF